MITNTNYFAEAKKIGIENLPDTFKKSHELVNKVTQNGSTWEMYNANATIKKTIDLYFDKLTEFAKDKPMPSFKEIKKAMPDRVVVVRTSHGKSEKTELKPKAKVVVIEPKTTKPKQANESKGTPVERIDDSIQLIKRYINFNGKQKSRDQVTNLLKAVQKAILERRVNKNSEYGKEVMQVQDSLLGALKHNVQMFDIKIESKQLEHYTAIANGVTPMPLIQLLKRYVGLQNKTGILDKVIRLRDDMQKWKDKNVLNNDKYYPYYAVASNNLNDYIQQVKVLKNKDAMIVNFNDAQLNGLGFTPSKRKKNLGFIPEMIAAAAGAAIQKHTHRLLSKKAQTSLSGVEPEVMSVAAAKAENFKEIGLTGDYLKLIGRACAPTSVFLYGNGGSGKSGLALKLADHLSQLGHSVMYAAGEQFGTPTFTELLRRVNIKGGDNFKLVKSLNSLPIANFDVIVIDSKESLNLEKSADFVQLRNTYPDKIWIITSQGTKAGEYAGDGKWKNEVDTFIYCENGKASTIGEKNRWGGKAEVQLF